MEKLKDVEKIKQMMEEGATECSDPGVSHRYSYYANCPNDNYECSAASYEREGMDYISKMGKITKVIFRCPVCDNVFSVEPEDMFLR